MHGKLDVTYTAAGISRRESCAPLSILHPKYGQLLDPGEYRIGTIRATGGGLASGDLHELNFTVTAGARVQLRTQAATLVHNMPAELPGAQQHTKITVTNNSFCELLPHQVILGAEARFTQSLHVEVDASSGVMVTDILATGRSYEHNMAAHLELTTRFVRDKRPLVVERFAGPGEVFNAQICGGSARCLASIWLIFPQDKPATSIATGLRQLELDDVSWGVSVLPGAAGLSIRVLGEQAYSVLDATHTLCSSIRELAYGFPLAPIWW